MTLVASGKYVDNEKEGEWLENEHEIGPYSKGVRHGTWKEYSSDSMLVKVSNYTKGELDGEQIEYDSLGRVSDRYEYDLGERVRTAADTTVSIEEELPRFRGCEDSGLEGEELDSCANRKLLVFIYSNIRYPADARESNIQGKALIQFVVDKDGTLGDFTVRNGLSKDIREEVLRVVRLMPKWVPGQKDGEPVKTQFTLPIVFQLQ